MKSIEKAAALRFTSETPAPFVVARGVGQLASRLVALAVASGVPVRSDSDLASKLVQLDPLAVIPEDLYSAVADVLVSVIERVGDVD